METIDGNAVTDSLQRLPDDEGGVKRRRPARRKSDAGDGNSAPIAVDAPGTTADTDASGHTERNALLSGERRPNRRPRVVAQFTGDIPGNGHPAPGQRPDRTFRADDRGVSDGGQHRAGPGRRIAPRGYAPEPQRDPSAAPGPERLARGSRRPAGESRGAGTPPVRFQSPTRPEAGRDRPDRPNRQRMDSPEFPRHDRSASPGAGPAFGRD